jgi:streptogramin lyase
MTPANRWPSWPFSKKSRLLSLALIPLALYLPSAIAQPSAYSFITIAGDSSTGSADGTNGTIRFCSPDGIAFGPDGNLFVADWGNRTIRRLTPAGTNWVSTTIAGAAGQPGAADGTNSEARFAAPSGLAVGPDGSLFVADYLAIRKITPLGTNWIVTTIAGLAGANGTADGTNQDARFEFATSVALNSTGDLFVTDLYRLRKIAHIGGDWVTTTISFSAYGFGQVNSLAFTSSGDLYVAGAYFVGNDGYYGVIAHVNQLETNWVGEIIPAPFGSGYRGFFQLSAAPDGRVFVTSAEDKTVWQGAPLATNWVWTKVAGQSKTLGSTDGTNDAALFAAPLGTALDSHGRLFVADAGNNTIRKLTPVGSNWVSSTIGGRAPDPQSADGTNGAALFAGPSGVAVDDHGSVYLADTSAHAIRETDRVGNDWVTHTIAGLLGSPGSADGSNTQALLNFPLALACGGSGVLYVADTRNHTIRKLKRIGIDWITSTVAGVPGSPGSQDGTNSDIRFTFPYAIAANDSGTLYVSDDNARLRKLSLLGTNWVSSTIASPSEPLVINSLNSLALAKGGELYFSTSYGGLYQLTPAGTNWVLRLIANDAAGEAIALDYNGDLDVTDAGNNVVRKVHRLGTNWVTYTIGGLESYSGHVDGTNAEARFLGPAGITADSAGRLYLTDGTTLRLGLRLPASAPAPQIQSLSMISGTPNFNWSATPGLYYQPQSSSDAGQGSWANLGNTIGATNKVMNTSDMPGLSRQRFYRVVLLP